MFALAALGVLAGAALAAPGDISTVAGTGSGGFSGDGAAAASAQINNPGTVAATADGGFLIGDQTNRRVRKVSTTGTITTVAGDGTSCFLTNPCGDGGAATSAQLSSPTGVFPTADGGFLIADQANARIRKVSATGTISTVAGTGIPGFSGDGGAATSAQLASPYTVSPTADGGFLIADSNNDRIRKVSATGTISTVAGTGSSGFSGDGGAATSAQLNNPNGISPTADGGFLIGDSVNYRIRKVSATGTITTVAGTGAFCANTTSPCGDGGPATSAQFRVPSAVATTTDGGFLIADQGDNRIRKVSATGTITTVAGDGTFGCSPPTGPCGDGGAATLAQLNTPNGVSPTADGGFLIADTSNHRIRRVEGAPPPAQGKISARGTVQTTQGPAIAFSAATNCNPLLSTQPTVVGTTAGARIWAKSLVTTSTCTDQSPVSPLGFDTQTGTATGIFGPAAPGGRNGQPGTLQWTYYDNSPDTVQFTLRDSSNTVVYQANQQTPSAYTGSAGGVWTFGP